MCPAFFWQVIFLRESDPFAAKKTNFKGENLISLCGFIVFTRRSSMQVLLQHKKVSKTWNYFQSIENAQNQSKEYGILKLRTQHYFGAQAAKK